MRLGEDEARARLAAQDHGVLCTVHRERGVDAVPVVYVLDDGYVGVPIDRVKPKASSRLQRERNLEADPRATLLVDHWDRDDWSQLWWVRVDGTGEVVDPIASVHADALAAKYAQYRETRPAGACIVVSDLRYRGWRYTAAESGRRL